MSDPATVARDYVEAVFARVRTPLEPPGFAPDWDDRPARFTTYPGALRLPLPVRPVPPARTGRFDLGSLSRTLLLSYGVLARRLRLNWNDETLKTASLPHATWGRGTPSGGGLYPLEIYWVSGPGGPLLPGLYHYSPGHHALERLAVADLTGPVRAALLDHPGAADTDQFLLVTARFWRNAFKYGNFSYHVIGQDLGALVGSWEALSGRLGIDLEYVLWFADEELNRLLGVRTDEESTLAVVPLPWEPPAVAPTRPDGGPLPSIRNVAYQHSRRVLRFPLADAVSRATLVDRQPRPAPSDGGGAGPAAGPAGECGIPLPPPAPRAGDVEAVLGARRSSFGGFRAAQPLAQVDLATVLAHAAQARDYRTDLRGPSCRPHLTRLSVVVNRVAGLAAGSYRYDPEGHRLAAVREGPVGALLQRSYLLLNYNLDQVGAVVAIVGRPGPAIDAFGARGYRALNVEVGVVAQATYLAATGAGLGCGAVLGLENIAMNELLGLTGTDERSLLFLLLGREPGVPAMVEAAVVPVERPVVPA